MKRFYVWILIASLITTTVPSRALALRAMSDDQYQSRISEYFFSPTGKEVLIPVQILGEIERPGLYHIPSDTSLTTLLAISGGTQERADVKKVKLFRAGAATKLDIDKILEEQPNFALRQQDTLYIPRKPEWINQNTLNAIIATSAVATTILTLFWIRSEARRD